MKKQYLLKLFITFMFCSFYQFISAQCEGVSIDGNSNNNIYTFASCNESRFINLQTPFQNPNVSVTPMNGAPNLINTNGGFIFQSINYTVVGLDPQPTPVYDYEVLVSDPANSSTQCKFNLHINIMPCQQILDLKTTLASCDSTNGSILIKMMNNTKINLIEVNSQKVVLSKQYGYGFDFNNYDTLKNLKAGSYRIEAWPDYSNNSNPIQIVYAFVKIPGNLKIDSKYQIVCEGNPLTLSAPSAQKYLWSTGETTQTIQVTKGGKYALEVIDPTTPLCKTKDTINLKFNPRLTLEVLQSYKDCNSNSLDIIYRVKGGTAPYYIQHGPLGSCYEGCLQKVDSVLTGNYWGYGYYVVASDATGCSVSKEYNHLPNSANLKLALSKNIKLCQGDSTVFNDLYPNEKGFKHQWYLDGQTLKNDTLDQFFAKKAGKYHVVVTTPWCEVKSDTVTVEEVVPDPIQFVLPNFPSCLGTLVTYQAEKNKSNYEWNILNQIKDVDYNLISGGTDTSSALSIIWNTEGPKQISLNYLNGFCKSKVPVILNSIAVAPSFLVALTSNQTETCQGVESTYNVINTNQNSGSFQPMNLTWDVPGAVKGVDYEIISTLEKEITIKWLKPAKYNLIVTNTGIGSVCGGNNTVVFDITVNPIEKPTIIADKGMVCIGNIIQYSTESGKQNYEWIMPNKIKGTDYLILEGGDSNSNTMKINWFSQGLNEVTVNYTSVSSLCKSEYPASTTTQVQMPIELVYKTPEKSDVCLNSIETYKVKNLNAPYSIMNQQNLIWTVYGDPIRDYKIIAGGNATDSSITIQWLKSTKTGIFVNTDNCGNSLSFDITVHDTINPKQLVSEIPKNLCNIDSLKLTISNLGTNSIQWYFNGNEISKAIDSFYYAKLPGKYNVVVKNTGNCSFKSDYFEFKKDTCNSSVAKLNIVQEDPIIVYPNPASTILNIDTRNTNVSSFSLVNVLGQEVFHSDLQGTKNEINLYQFAKGMYILSFFNEKYEIISSQKISIE